MPEGDKTDALLCEFCGYPLDGLDTSPIEGGGGGGACPECGELISRSLPAARVGSPWQQGAGIASWWKTHRGTLLSPRELFGTLRIERGGWRSLLVTTLPVAGLLLVAPWSGTLIGDPARAARASGKLAQGLAYALVVPFEACLAALFLFALTYIEWRGIRFFAWQRGWRLTADAAWQVCAHASVGWIIGALVPMLVMAVLWAAPGGRPSLLDRLLSRGGGGSFGSMSGGDAILVTLMIGSYVVGLCVFEMLIYVGVRKCRFANRGAGERAPAGLSEDA